MKTQQTKKIEKNEKDQNFFKIPHALIDSKLLARMKPSEIKVYLVIAKFANYKTSRAFPSIALICELTGMNKNVVCRAIKRLEHFGLIEKYRAPKGFKFRNVYNVLRDPEINPLIIPQKVEKKSTRFRKKDGKWGVIPQNMETDTFPQNVELHTLPQNMEGKYIERDLNRDSFNNKQHSSLKISEKTIEEFRRLKGDKWLKKYLLDHGYSLGLLNRKKPALKQKTAMSKIDGLGEDGREIIKES